MNNENMKICTVCGELKPIKNFGYNPRRGKEYRFDQCRKCVRKIFNVEVHNRKLMYENKNCSTYLGVVIGERLCKHLFKDVKVMPYCNPGFDIICNKGMKIDVKTVCLSTNNNNWYSWKFNIKNNKLADYFILVAFDNRRDLNVLHMWMIPGNEINDKVVASISPSTTNRWKQWERDINDVQLCCTTMKGD